MSTCKNYREKRILYVYDELSEAEKSEFEVHLNTCSNCSAELAQLKKMQQTLPAQPYKEPDEATMQLLRNNISQRIRSQAIKSRNGVGNLILSLLQPAPALRIGFAMAVFAVGFFLGSRNLSSQAPQQDTALESLLTANQQIQSQNSAINPLLASVEKISYDSQSGNIEISYTTVNDIQLQGKVENPAVRQLLRQAILERENPTVRLHAVKAVKSLVEKQTQLEPEILEALTLLINNEENLGVRLKVLNVLKALLPNPYAKATLVRILLDDPNPPMRIAALEALLDHELAQDDIGILHQIARQDTNNYLRSQAQQTIDKYGVTDEQ